MGSKLARTLVLSLTLCIGSAGTLLGCAGIDAGDLVRASNEPDVQEKTGIEPKATYNESVAATAEYVDIHNSVMSRQTRNLERPGRMVGFFNGAIGLGWEASKDSIISMAGPWAPFLLSVFTLFAKRPGDSTRGEVDAEVAKARKEEHDKTWDEAVKVGEAKAEETIAALRDALAAAGKAI